MAIALGKQAEEIVARYLAQCGFVIVAKNQTFPYGEIDIVAREGETLVFVEVKYRKNIAFGMPADAVGKSKQKKIIRAAYGYLQNFKKEPLCRFDVVSVWGDLTRPTIEHLRDAFVIEDD